MCDPERVTNIASSAVIASERCEHLFRLAKHLLEGVPLVTDILILFVIVGKPRGGDGRASVGAGSSARVWCALLRRHVVGVHMLTAAPWCRW
jgi:hypothetical protein